MSTRVVGKLDSWDDGDLGDSDYANLEEGHNVMRLVTSPYQMYVHWNITDQSGAKRKIQCALQNCPLCQQGERATARWLVGVINRKTDTGAVVEIGTQIFKQILNLKKDSEWGSPKKYDIDVIRGPKNSQPLYTVNPKPHKSLTDDEIGMIKEFLARVDIGKMVEAPSPEQIKEKLGLPTDDSPAVDNDFSDSSDDDYNFDD